jgi:hypothetical protein
MAKDVLVQVASGVKDVFGAIVPVHLVRSFAKETPPSHAPDDTPVY